MDNGGANGAARKEWPSSETNEDTRCGFGPLKGPLLQRLANKNAFVVLYGLSGCLFAALYAYYLGTLTTLEKRFKLSSRTTGIISIGYDVSLLVASTWLTYYAGKGHRPRWVALGLLFIAFFSIFSVLPHVIYGSGEDALSLTLEYGGRDAKNNSNDADQNAYHKSMKLLCSIDRKKKIEICPSEEGSLMPSSILFLAQFLAGIGGSLYYTMGVSYMDDNVKKSKTPALISLSYFLKMLGPSIGFGFASLCLKEYISPTLTPTITTGDPRWLGAWWIGFVVFSIPLLLVACLTGMFPKILPSAAERKHLANERLLNSLSNDDREKALQEENSVTSFDDMKKTFFRLMKNKVYMINNLAAAFYLFGYTPYWMFMPKYIETQYSQSASTSNLITGSVGLVFSAAGVLTSGIVISRFLPSARALALWNVFGGFLSVLGSLSYIFLGCENSDIALLSSGELKSEYPCNADCYCDYVKYTPVCSAADGITNFISPCHAGCKRELPDSQSQGLMYGDCLCVGPPIGNTSFFERNAQTGALESIFDLKRDKDEDWKGGQVTAGACQIDCATKFYMFLTVVCLLKFIGATSLASNFLVSVRCVEEKDKAISMGLGATLVSILSFVPGPIIFGYIMDTTCLVWGKTCTGSGNCWLYNGQKLRYTLNLIASAFLLLGTIFDGGVWYYVKELSIFDEDEDKIDTKLKKSKNNRPSPEQKEATQIDGSNSHCTGDLT